MDAQIPRTAGITGGVLILASGIVSALLGLRMGAFFYEPDPGGRFGHVGIVAGLAAVAIGMVIVWLAARQYQHKSRRIAAAILTMLLGHAGAIAGALIVGTAGMILCYVAGIWLLVRRER